MAKLEIADQDVTGETEPEMHQVNAGEIKQTVPQITRDHATKSQELESKRLSAKDCDKTETITSSPVEDQSNNTEISDYVDERVEADKVSDLK